MSWDDLTFGGRKASDVAAELSSSFRRDPYALGLDDLRKRYYQDFGAGFGLHTHRAHAFVSGITDSPAPTPAFWVTVADDDKFVTHSRAVPGSVPVHVTPNCEAGTFYAFDFGGDLSGGKRSVTTHPDVAYRIRFGDLRAGGPRPPFWTQHDLGVREANRDRRLSAR